jgi:hypothetical protein
MTDPRRAGGRDARTTTPKTDPDTAAGHRPARTQPGQSTRQDGPAADPTRIRDDDAAPAAEPNEIDRPRTL